MDNARTQFASDGGERSKVMQEGIDQGAAIAGIVGGSRARMHHHARGLVDDGEVVVFIDDVERNFFGNSAQRSGVRRAGDRDLLIATAFET